MEHSMKTSGRYKVFAPTDRPNLASPITESQRRSWKETPAFQGRRVDVVIAGAGISGFAAAIALTRRGREVVVVEPTHMVGGQATAGGVSAFDITFHYDHAINDHGIWSELLANIKDVYDNELNRPLNVGHYRDIAFTPNVVVVERVMGEMLAKEGVEVLRNTRITGALRDGARVSGIETTAGTIHARITIDATEDGCVTGYAGVPHRLSNGVSNGLTERLITSKRKAIQDITYTAIIQEYPHGIPEELQVRVPPANYDRYARQYRIFFPPADVMDPDKKKLGPVGFAGFRAAPDLSSDNMHTGSEWDDATRTNLNYKNDFPVGADYLTDPEARMRYEAEAKLKTISIIYYLQNELGLPWSVSTDEGYADGPIPPRNPLVPDVYIPVEQHMPVIPYIRESRRIIGMETVTGKDIQREPNRSEATWRTDSIAVGTYHPDLHGGRLANDFESHLGESLEDKPKTWREGPFPIPLGALIPEWVDGFIAAEKNISTTRLASGATRLHPTVSGIGEAAGALAALCLQYDAQPRQIPVAAVQYDLAKNGALLTPLYVSNAERSDPDFANITLAVARKRATYILVRPKGAEPFIEVVERPEAIEAGAHSVEFIGKWLSKNLQPAS